VSIRVIDELVEQALRELADQAMQTRLWLASSGPEIASLDECQCTLFDDSGLGDALDKAHVVYAPQVDDHLRELRLVLHRIDHNRPPQHVLDDEFLHEARARAQGLLEELRAFGNARVDQG
jgi:hypothetical protein